MVRSKKGWSYGCDEVVQVYIAEDTRPIWVPGEEGSPDPEGYRPVNALGQAATHILRRVDDNTIYAAAFYSEGLASSYVRDNRCCYF